MRPVPLTQAIGCFTRGGKPAHVGHVGNLGTDGLLRRISTRSIGRALPFGQQHVQQPGPVPGAQGFQQA